MRVVQMMRPLFSVIHPLRLLQRLIVSSLLILVIVGCSTKSELTPEKPPQLTLSNKQSTSKKLSDAPENRATGTISNPKPATPELAVDQYKLMLRDSGDYFVSRWLESEKQQYRRLLNKARADVLVVPFQTQGYAIDRIGRSLMTRYLADSITSTSSLVIANPTLVARALGENARIISSKEVYGLANALGVSTLIWGHVGHQRDQRLNLSIYAQQRTEGAPLSFSSPGTQRKWQGIEFSDEHLPSEVFLDLTDEILGILPFETRKYPQPRLVREVVEPKIPFTPHGLADGRSLSAIEAAYYLQSMGMLSSRHTAVARERMYERSLVAIRHISSNSPDYALLKARAYFYLHRRPAALEALGDPQRSENRALKYLLNGDLNGLEAAANSIQSPLKKLLSKIELFDLKISYSGRPLKKGVYDAVIKNFPNWKALLERRVRDYDKWGMQSNLHIKKILEKDFPADVPSADELLAANIAIADPLRMIDEAELSVYRHIRFLLNDRSKEWCCTNENWRPNNWDYLGVLQSVAESNIIQSVNFMLNVQAKAKTALEILAIYLPVYDGHPTLSYFRSAALVKMARKRKGVARKNIFNEAVLLSKKVYQWSGGQTPISRRTSKFLLKKSVAHPFYNGDFPRRHFWFPNILDGDQKIMLEEQGKNQVIANMIRSLIEIYSQWLRRA